MDTSKLRVKQEGRVFSIGKYITLVASEATMLLPDAAEQMIDAARQRAAIIYTCPDNGTGVMTFEREIVPLATVRADLDECAA